MAHLKIGSSNHSLHTFSNQYAFYAHMSADQTGISNNTWTKVNLVSESFGTFDTTNKRFDVPKTGKYQINYRLRWAEGEYGRFTALYVDGSLSEHAGAVNFGFSSYTPTYYFSVLLNLTKGQTVELYGKQVSGSDKSIAHDDDSILQTAMSGFLVLGG